MENDHRSGAPRQPAALLARNRPQSRASTASANSAATHPQMDSSGFADTSEVYAQHWIHHDHHSGKELDHVQQMPQDAMLLHAAQHMSASNHSDFAMSNDMGGHMPHHMPYPSHAPQQMMQHHALAVGQYGPNASFTDGNVSMIDQEEQEDRHNQSKHSSRSSANNEYEMRQLFEQNRTRNIQDVAKELHGNERGPNSERTRQLFAMLWINSVCSRGKGSVPRGRVYANYASRCAREKVTVLNPASFGKLVRVLFPGLKTRRLGVRGESKYHYVNFELLDDQPEFTEEPSFTQPLLDAALLDAASSAQSLSKDPAPKPSEAIAAATDAQPETAATKRKLPTQAPPRKRMRAFYHHQDHSYEHTLMVPWTKSTIDLAFPVNWHDDFDQTEALTLPDIEPYLPDGTDRDAAKSLRALYLSHGTSLIECVRYCREKSFFHLYSSFQGTLTMPVQKLFTHPAIAPWIEKCDLALYQRMAQLVSKLVLQVVPKPVLDTLRHISEKLVPSVREIFQGQPNHVVQAKQGPATLFAALLDRSLRVNITAHAAANMLSNPANREQMLDDWISLIHCRKLAQSLPADAADEVVPLLFNDIRETLDTSGVSWDDDAGELGGNATSKFHPASSGKRNGDARSLEKAAPVAGNFLDRWVHLLLNLPQRFPGVSHYDIVDFTTQLGTSIMRELTLTQGPSFGSWWVTKCWIDEMVNFLGEYGGFLQYTGELEEKARASSSRGSEMNRAKTSLEESSAHLENGEPTTDLVDRSDKQPGRAPFPPPSQNGVDTPPVDLGGDSHDDSGIAMRTPADIDDEFSMDKFTTFSGSENVVLYHAEPNQPAAA